MRGRLLLVEDNVDLRETVRDLLESQGYAVEVAGNGAVALEILRAGCTPCLILLDLMMPVMDGYRFCLERAEDSTLASIPVVIFSAMAKLDASLPAGVEKVLRKPVSVEAILGTVEQYCLA
ncbi:MAG: response regulator [Casimicrobiaceae bacterium]